MAKYATAEELFDCWVCGAQLAMRHMWSTETRPHVKRCPNCNDNVFLLRDGELIRSTAYYEVPVLAPDDAPWLTPAVGEPPHP